MQRRWRPKQKTRRCPARSVDRPTHSCTTQMLMFILQTVYWQTSPFVSQKAAFLCRHGHKTRGNSSYIRIVHIFKYIDLNKLVTSSKLCLAFEDRVSGVITL